MKQTTLHDARGRMILLAEELGRGGEGTVFAIHNEPQYAAKIYHRLPLPHDTVAKVKAMVDRNSPALRNIAAWPASILYQDQLKEPCGLLLPRISASRQLHELYGTLNRRKHFPDAQWQHLVLAARNTAAAFDAVHDHNIVVGDINQGNLLVDRQMCVRFIDCDSFQICDQDKVYRCMVGTPHLTPPELQSTQFAKVTRTKQNDCFGLAVLIFHLLFVGRHPFAGRYRGSGDLSIEQAIQGKHFAFSTAKDATLMDPPPASLALADIPASLAELFELAFCGDPRGNEPRPTAWEWVSELDNLLKHRKSCQFDDSHTYYRKLAVCPWCRIEGMGGPALFQSPSFTASLSSNWMETIDEQIHQFKQIKFPRLPANRLQEPRLVPRDRSTTRTKTGLGEISALALPATGLLAIAALMYPPALPAAAVISFMSAAYLLFAPSSRQQREQAASLEKRTNTLHQRMRRATHRLTAEHEERKNTFNKVVKELNMKIKNYKTDDQDLRMVLREYEIEELQTQKNEFLRQHIIRGDVADRLNLPPLTISMLESYGIESALEIDDDLLYGTPNLHQSTMINLKQWRASIEQKFVFKPSLGMTSREVQLGNPATIRNIKAFQSTKIIASGKRMNLLAQTGQNEIAEAVHGLQEIALQWKRTQHRLLELQASRLLPEKLINHSTVALTVLAIGLPLIYMGLYFLQR